MAALAIDALSWLALAGGAFFIVVGAIGLIRMPDVFSRLHPAGMIDTMGVVLTVLGLALQAGLSQVTVKLVLIVVFVLFTSPTATHALAHAAVAGGLRPWRRSGEPER